MKPYIAPQIIVIALEPQKTLYTSDPEINTIELVTEQDDVC